MLLHARFVCTSDTNTFQKKFEGTRVTIENFLLWKAKFDAEMAELNKQKLENDPTKSKLSGLYNFSLCSLSI